jgi:hypothetical protein
MMKHASTERKFIAITLLLVVLLGVRTAESLMEEDAQQNSVYAVENGADAEDAAVARAPASIPQNAVAVKPSSMALVDLDLSCAKKPEAVFKISGNFVQLKGKNCLKNFKEDKIEIINKSNGYTASIFPFGRNQYQTDMIQLVNGDNEITIRYGSAEGPRYEQTIKVSSSSI